MNGQNLMEALSFVDEEYIEQAEATARRFRWQPFAAAAACLGVVLLSARLWMPVQKGAGVEMAAYSMDTVEADQADGAPAVGAAPMMVDAGAVNGSAYQRSALQEMTVCIERYEEETAVCTVTDPGTSDYEVGQQVRVRMPQPEETGTTMATAREIQTEYRVLYVPGEDDTLEAIELTPVEETE